MSLICVIFLTGQQSSLCLLLWQEGGLSPKPEWQLGMYIHQDGVLL